MSQRESTSAPTGAAAIRVQPLRSPADRAAFLALPRLIRRGDPVWVEPLRFDQSRLLSPSHPFYEHGRAAEARFFLARDSSGRPVGRVAAIVNHLHNQHAGVREGFFGFFDAIDDQATANALLDTAAAWLRERGMTALLGPASPSHNYEYGLLIDGFDQPHRFLLAHNPAYYPALLERWGLRKARDLYAFAIKVDDPTLRAEIARDGARIRALSQARSPEIQVRSADLKRFAQEVRVAVDLVNRSLAGNWGYSPMTEGELREMARTLRYLVDPHLLLIAERAGEPIAVALIIPDLNLLLRKLRFRSGLPGVLELVLRFKLTHVPVARAVALGVAQDRASATAGIVLMHQVYERLVERNFQELDASWILEDNHQMLLPLKRFGLEPNRTYRIYQAEL